MVFTLNCETSREINNLNVCRAGERDEHAGSLHRRITWRFEDLAS